MSFPEPPFRDGEEADLKTRQEARATEAVRSVIAALHPLTAALLECVTPAEVVEAVVERGVTVLGARAGLVALVADDGEHLEIVRTSGYSPEVMKGWERFPLAADLPLSDTVRGNEVLLFEGGSDWRARYPDMVRQIPRGNYLSSASLPLSARGNVFGALHFSFLTERSFSAADQEFLADLSRQCALALDRAILLERAERSRLQAEVARDEAQAANRRLLFLARASALLGESLDYHSRLEALARLCVPEIADWAGVDVLDEGGNLARLAVAHRDPAREEAMREIQRRYPPQTQRGSSTLTVIQTGERLFFPDIPEHLIDQGTSDKEHARLLKTVGVKAALSLPLTARGNTLGALSLGMGPEPVGSGRSFTEETVSLAEELARRAAVLIDNARLFQQAQREVAERARAERQAEQVAADLRLITDAAPLLIAYVGADLRYRFVNKGYADWFGAPQGEIMGRSAEGVLGPAAFAKVRPRLLAALSGERLSFEEILAYSAGNVRYVHADYVPDRGGDGTVRGVVAVVSDITARRQAESEREAARRQTEVVLESIGEMFYALDAEFRLTYVNRRVEEAWGKSRQEVLGRVLWDVIPQVVGTTSYHAHQEAMRERRTVRYQAVSAVLHRWIECSCYPAEDGGISVYFRDIQEQKEAETALREGEARQRRLAREMLYSLTEGKMRLADTTADLPNRLSSESDAVALSPITLRVLRKQVEEVAEKFGFVKERCQDLLTAVGEASMNAVKHARDGVGSVFADPERGTIQVWVTDQGTGIAADQIHRALERGWTTGGFGHGWWFILKAVDRVYLLTGPTGTTVVLEIDRDVAAPEWLVS